MNQQETIALFEECEALRERKLAEGNDEDQAHEAAKLVWNSWAKKVLAEREGLEGSGSWATVRDVFGGDIGPWNNETREWMKAAAVDFSGVCFRMQGADEDSAAEVIEQGQVELRKYINCGGNTINFRGFIFPGLTSFKEVSFQIPALFGGTKYCLSTSFFGADFGDYAEFGGVIFEDNTNFSKAAFKSQAFFVRALCSGPVVFDNVRFSGEAWFRNVKFSKTAGFEMAQFFAKAGFEGAIFSDLAWFRKATFFGEAWFGLAEFHQFGHFVETRFFKTADFRAIRGERGFTLEGAVFEKLPEFGQAHFSEAPRLDNLTLASSVEGGRFWRSLWHPSTVDASARYRAIRRLAVQGHDSYNERLFLKGEIRSRRLILDKPWHAAFWFGVGYDVFSDFGGAIARPIFWGVVLIVTFAAIYYNLVFTSCGQTPSEALDQSLYLSLKNAVLLINWDNATDIPSTTDCLSAAKRASTKVALGLAVIQITQKVFSATLLFLFLLAVRNRFRIK